jgi:glycosyltransferase involved in cell wall biosynthesis
VPAYNQAHYLGESIQSVLDQTYQDFEIVVVDDGSTDNTHQVAEGFDDPRIRYIYQENGGLSAARNTGIRHTTGCFLTFLDADDLLLPGNLASLATALETEPETGFVAGQTVLFDDRDRRLRTDAHPSKPLDDSSQLLLGNRFAVGSMMVRRSWLEKVEPFDETLRACEDWDLWLRLAKAGCSMKLIKEPVFLYRVHSEQMTRGAKRMRQAMLAVLDKTFGASELPGSWQVMQDRAYAAAYVNAAARAYNAGEYADARHDLVEAVRLDPALTDGRYRRLVTLLEKWSRDPRSSDPEGYLRRIYAHPPPLPGLRRELRRAMAAAVLGPMFAGSRGTWRAGRLALLRAVWYDPAWLLNRGVLRMLVEAWLPDFGWFPHLSHRR